MLALTTLAAAALLLVGLFLLTWRVSLRVDNFSIVDVAWAYAFAPVAILYAICLEGWVARRIVIAGLVTLWSLRLGTYLLRRAAAHHPEEDARYTVLRERWSADLNTAFLRFFLAQAVLVWLLMLPVFLICREAHEGFHALELIGFVLWLIALGGEALADAQLRRYKSVNHDSKGVCSKGLWHFSRHPNYFFQALLWWGLFFMALPAPWGWTAVLAPLGMLWFLLRVTGIPLTESLALESKGEAYREYQRTTSALIPWIPRS